MQALRGAREVALLSHGDEVTQMAQLHDDTPEILN
jgi:hypothetical protein